MSRKKKTPVWALDNVRFDSDAGENLTCREYLCELLALVWEQEQGFNGKRPFGNSGWQHDMLCALSEAGCIKGTKDDWGIVPDDKNGDAFVFQMIGAMSEVHNAS